MIIKSLGIDKYLLKLTLTISTMSVWNYSSVYYSALSDTPARGYFRASRAPCVNTTNQTDLCWSVWRLWLNPWPFLNMCVYIHQCMQTLCLPQTVHFAKRAKDERSMIIDKRLRKGKEKTEWGKKQDCHETESKRRSDKGAGM